MGWYISYNNYYTRNVPKHERGWAPWRGGQNRLCISTYCLALTPLYSHFHTPRQYIHTSIPRDKDWEHMHIMLTACMFQTSYYDIQLCQLTEHKHLHIADPPQLEQAWHVHSSKPGLAAGCQLQQYLLTTLLPWLLPSCCHLRISLRTYVRIENLDWEH
jgi:hypothetical protein